MNNAKKVRIAINGFGRIGRQAFKLFLQKKNAEVVAINDLTEPAVLAHLLEYDSNYGKFDRDISADPKHLFVGRQKIPVFAEKDPSLLPWKKLRVDVVVESTGRFTDSVSSGAHLKAGARRVVISAPAKDEGQTPTIVLGVNQGDYDGQKIISNASCTTNCITPVIAVLHEKFGIEKAFMTTVHSYTAEQNLVDGPPPGGKANDLRRARAAAVNIIPTSTGAAISTTRVLPELVSKFDGFAIRVPTPVGSLSDFTMLFKQDVTAEQVNSALSQAAKNARFKGILAVSSLPLVSTDIVGDPHSAIVDLSLTKVVGGNLVKVVAWYDNEFGYSNRLVEQVLLVGQK